MRPAYLTPKLTTAHRVAIRRLRAENPREWTLEKLAGRFGVNRSTIARALRKRERATVEQELSNLRSAIEDSGSIATQELFRLKTQEWNRQLLTEVDLGRQQQLVNLIKSVAVMIEEAEKWERERPRTIAEIQDQERRALEALKGWRAEYDRANSGGNQTMPPSGSDGASAV